ncbi:MAG: DUF3108 domain-containing protein [Proteobacteria bacterium]|nr:DUF3108 domain-containing protein [Pseudomonadota bacterium]
MLRQLQYFICVALVLIGGVASAHDSLTPHAAEYRVKISVLGGKLRTRIEKTDTGYFAQSSIVATGMSKLLANGAINESSRIAESDQGLLPLHFISSDTISKGGQEVDLTFDWNEDVVAGLIDGAEFQALLEGKVHDRVSLQYGLMHDLLSGIERSEYALQDAEQLKLLSITNIGRKTVKVPFGRFEAIGIQHQAESSSRITTLWCVEELGFLPVIIEQHRKGKRQMRAELDSYTPL